jgi:lipopolysaccharide/colanic/teichoic acid biosynthesis glycosyltransferase
MEQITLPLPIPKLPDERLASPTGDGQRAGAMIIATEPLSSPVGRETSRFYTVSKRFLDIALALFGMLLLLPVFALIALCIKFDDGGSVLHFREIIGRHGRRFYALKFRTMIPDADTYLAKYPELMQKFHKNMKLENDPRVTRVGRFLRKTSLDELPQLYNVLIGQMTLVGPRIIHPSELPRYGKFAPKRLSLRPGITGLWQISGRQHISYQERIQLDMLYIDTRCFYVDLVILVKTLKVFIKHTGA